MKLTLLMVLSPGEAELAADSLARARALVPGDWPAPNLVLVDNTGSGELPATNDAWPTVRIVEVPGAPRPYFEIARTIARGLAESAGLDGELVFKIDPDTVILSPDFFRDIAGLHRSMPADFYSWFIRYPGLHADARRMLRLCLDTLPLGLARSQGGDRYGQRLKFRVGAAWHAAATRRVLLRFALKRAQPSGGGYAVNVNWLRSGTFQTWARDQGPNGLEWNDDTLLPLAILSDHGRLIDVRDYAPRAGWRWMHGTRYFKPTDVETPGVRALHPLKNNPDDWAIRRSLPLPSTTA